MGRQRPTAGLTEDTVLARLAASDHDLAARALRRHRAWRDAAERGASARAQRTLRRAWQRARDDALIALSAAAMSPPSGASTRSTAAPTGASPRRATAQGPSASLDRHPTPE